MPDTILTWAPQLGTNPPNTRHYTSIGSVGSNTESDVQIALSMSGVLQDFRVKVSVNGKDGDTVVAFRANGTNLAYVTVPAGATGEFVPASGLGSAIVAGTLINSVVDLTASTNNLGFRVTAIVARIETSWYCFCRWWCCWPWWWRHFIRVQPYRRLPPEMKEYFQIMLPSLRRQIAESIDMLATASKRDMQELSVVLPVMQREMKMIYKILPARSRREIKEMRAVLSVLQRDVTKRTRHRKSQSRYRKRKGTKIK